MDSEKQPEGLERAGVEGWGNQVVGIREGTDCMEHWVSYTNNVPWNTTSKTNDVLYSD